MASCTGKQTEGNGSFAALLMVTCLACWVPQEGEKWLRRQRLKAMSPEELEARALADERMRKWLEEQRRLEEERRRGGGKTEEGERSGPAAASRVSA